MKDNHDGRESDSYANLVWFQDLLTEQSDFAPPSEKATDASRRQGETREARWSGIGWNVIAHRASPLG